MHGHDDWGHKSRREAWRVEREAKRAAWRARRAARHASRGDWSHFRDPKFWGLDAESMKGWGMSQPGFGQTSEVEALKAKVAEMEKTMAAMNQRIIVLEKLIVDDDVQLAREIEKLRDKPGERPHDRPEGDK